MTLFAFDRFGQCRLWPTRAVRRRSCIPAEVVRPQTLRRGLPRSSQHPQYLHIVNMFAGASMRARMPRTGASFRRRCLNVMPTAGSTRYQHSPTDMSTRSLSTVRVTVSELQATALFGADTSGLSDPFAKLSCGKESFQTEVCPKTLNPVWNKTRSYEFGSKQNLETVDGGNICVKIYDHNSIQANVLLGEVDLPFDDLWDNQGRTFVYDRPVLRGGAECGSLHVAMKMTGYVPAGMSSPASGGGNAFSGVGAAAGDDATRRPSLVGTVTLPGLTDPSATPGTAAGTPPPLVHAASSMRPPNVLTITLKKARNLKPTSTDGTCNPRVTFTVAGDAKPTTVKSPVLKATIAPVWNKSFTFPARSRTSTFKLVLEHKVPLLANGFLGAVVGDVADYREGKETWLELKGPDGKTPDGPRGDVLVYIHWSFDSSYDDVEAKMVDIEADDAAASSADAAPVVETEAEKAAKKEEMEKALKELQDKHNAVRLEDGDYQVQVHVIEVRDLKGENKDGTSDPVVFVEVCGQKKHTSVHKETVTCVFDEILFFTIPKATRQILEKAIIKVSVFDANTVTKDRLIGLYEFDFSDMYYRDGHELWRQWVALVDPLDKKDKGIQGYLKLSVAVLGPSDTLVMHSSKEAEEKDAADEQAQSDDKGKSAIGSLLSGSTGGNSMDSICLLPPSIKRELHFLVLSVFRAEGLPKMDREILGGVISRAGIDAYVAVDFAGNKPLKTSVKTVQGEGNLKCDWNEQMWIPVMTPAMSNIITLTVWDKDATKDEQVGTSFLDYKDVCAGVYRSHPVWVNVYGPPSGCTGHQVEKMLKYPDLATNWRGRILISAREDIDEKKVEPEEPHKKKTNAPAPGVMPHESMYTFKSLVLAGDMVPKVSDLNVLIKIGEFERMTSSYDASGGSARWNLPLKGEVPLPVATQMPDTFVYLVKGTNSKPKHRICYLRLPTAELVAGGLTKPARWHQMHRDKAVDGLKDGQFPGSLLLRLGLSDATSVDAEDEASWIADLKRLSIAPKHYELWIHVYQARNLPAADASGSIDPYVVVKFMGHEAKTTVKKQTKNPSWYETIRLDVDMTDVDFAPPVLLEVWDWDKFDSNDLACHYRYPLNGNSEMSTLRCNPLLAPLPDTLPDPCWVTLEHFSEPDHARTPQWGSLLVSFQLIEKRSPTDVVPRIPASIEPEADQSFVEIIVLGLRDLAPFQLQKIHAPFLEFDCGDRARSTDVVMTHQSKLPSGENPNYLERVLLPIRLPKNPVFAPTLNITVRDSRLGGFLKPVIGVASIPLQQKLPKPGSASGSLMSSSLLTASDAPPPAPPAPVRVAPAPAATGGAGGPSSLYGESSPLALGELPVGAGTGISGGSIPLAQTLRARLKPPSSTAMPPSAMPAPPTTVPVMAAPPTSTASNLISIPPSPALKDEPDYDPDYIAKVERVLSSASITNWNKNLVTERGEEETEEPDEKIYMKNRRVYTSGLEDAYGCAPFETYPITRGQAVGRGKVLGIKLPSTLRTVGYFKGLIRIIKSADVPPPFDMRKLFVPRPYVVRVYVMDGDHVQPSDGDPFLKLKLGNVKIDDSEHHCKKTFQPEFFRSYELSATLPGPSRLDIELWDYDKFSANDFIGRTTIDIEDRWFEQTWQSMGTEFETPKRFRLKPLEERAFFSPTSRAMQGMVRMWVDIMTPEQAKQYPRVKIEKPPPEDYELRVILWRAQKVKCMDEATGMNDLFAKMWLENGSFQESDTHWRSKKGIASWNWRFKFNLTLPMKEPRLHIQLWDRDIFKWNDYIGERVLSLKDICRKCRHNKERINLLTGQIEKAAQKTASAAVTGGGPGNIGLPKSAPSKVSVLQSPLQIDSKSSKRPVLTHQGTSRGHDSVCVLCTPGQHHAPDHLLLVSDLPEGHHSLFQSLHHGKNATVIDVKPEQPSLTPKAYSPPQLLATPKAAAPTSDPPTPAPVPAVAPEEIKGEEKTDAADVPVEKSVHEVDEEHAQDEVAVPVKPAVDTTVDEEDAITAANESFASIKKAIGIEEEVSPVDGIWFDLFKTNPKTKVRENNGRVLLSVEIMPKAMAEKIPAGLGRKEPNQNPFLPPPSGRLKLSLNPFKMFSQICGPGMCFRICCCFIILALLVACIFLAPFLNVVIPVFNSIPHPFGWVIFFGILGFMCVPMWHTVVKCCRQHTKMMAAFGKKTDTAAVTQGSEDFATAPSKGGASAAKASTVRQRKEGKDEAKVPLLA